MEAKESAGPGEGAALVEEFGGLSGDGFLAWLGVLQAQALVTGALGRVLEAKCGLSLAEFEVLVRLELAPGRRMRMQELARSVFLSKSGVSRLVGRMEAAGLVERRGNPDNLRVTYATITAEGREALWGAVPVQLAGVEERFSRHLSAEEAKVMRRALGKVIRGNGEEPWSPARP